MSVIELKKPYGKWSELDFLLLEAVGIIEAETPAHGVPAWLAFNPDGNIGFRVEEKVDYAQRALDKYEDDRKKKMEKKGTKSDAFYGVGRYVVPFAVDEGQLPSREDYYKRLAEEQAELN